jgi:hypothetical protein
MSRGQLRGFGNTYERCVHTKPGGIKRVLKAKKCENAP